MKNNRRGLHEGRGDPRQRSGSRGDPPAICGTSGDPPWMFASRGDPPEIFQTRGHPPEKYLARGRPPKIQNKPINSLNYELIFREIGCQNGSHGRGMPNSEQPPSHSPKGESISLRGKGLTEKETNIYLKYTIINDVDRSILAPFPYGEGRGGALK